MHSLGSTAVAVSLATLLLTSVLLVGPVAGLGWDRSGTGADPDTAGSVATYRVALVADDGDTIVANGLGRVVLLFGADPDFSGSLVGVSGSDVRVSLDDGTGTTAVDDLRVRHNAVGDRLRITLSTPVSLSAGDRLTVEVDGVESSALSVADADTERFGLRVKAFDPTGARDVKKVRYALHAGEDGPDDPIPTPVPDPTPAGETLALSQGASCLPIEPLGDGTETVTAFYDYRSPYTDPAGWYTSYGTTALQTTDTSQLFVYRGSDGLSLVFVHDRTKAGTETGGGTVDADVSGLPVGSEWAVEDDEYPGRDDVFTLSGSTAHAEWVWNDGTRTDGGAIRLGDDVETVRVTMRFNEASSRYPYEKWKTPPEDNHLDRWIVRSGDGTTHTLDMDRSIAIRPGTCD